MHSSLSQLSRSFFLLLCLATASISAFAQPPTKAFVTSAPPVAFHIGAFSFKRPENWKWENPSSPMRKAQLSIPGKNGATATVTFFYFGPGQGGTVQANVDRWAAQFSSQNGSPVKPTTTSQKTTTTSVTFVSASGTFASGMPGGPTQACPNYALRGAIMESAQGDVYIKMTGPEDLVQAETATFDEMVLSAK
ncbi:MAG: hypothetical protein FJ390_04335 [Verrucomicrobia bacterium]|nr:hypothetical protein [Verrucomicrobiota bacterium]